MWRKSLAKTWREGETTNSFVSPEISFPKSSRFQLHSIYWPSKERQTACPKRKKSKIDEEAFKVSRLIDEQHKNQLRKGRASLDDKVKAERRASSTLPHNGFSTFQSTKSQSLDKFSQKVIFRLTQDCNSRQSKLRDRHGHRANLLENQQQLINGLKKDENEFRSTDKGFFTSRRINLNLPHNYYPGPGSYHIIRYLDQNVNKEKHLTIPVI